MHVLIVSAVCYYPAYYPIRLGAKYFPVWAPYLLWLACRYEKLIGQESPANPGSDGRKAVLARSSISTGLWGVSVGRSSSSLCWGRGGKSPQALHAGRKGGSVSLGIYLSEFYNFCDFIGTREIWVAAAFSLEADSKLSCCSLASCSVNSSLSVCPCL